MDLRRYNTIFLFSVIFSAVFALAGISVLEACTLWSAVGNRVAHGGSLIAKNRDWTPEPSAVRLVHPDAGFRSLGLFPIRDGKQRNIVAGVNEKGLVIVTASASSVPEADREKGGSNLTRQLLTVFSTVEDVQVNKSVFARTHPSMFLIADRRQTAWIEVAPEGKFSIRTIKKGVLTHTNHYLDETLIDVNGKIGRSSRTRLGRIGELLERHTAPLTLEDFIAFSQDRNDGPDDSLWRTGSKPDGKRTLASWIVSLPPAAPPELFVRLANPGEPERTIKMTLDGPFWKSMAE
ncbi:MAG: carcinine hydrolase/isopenicillin-N N-acyltransferase family protein [Syntrophales bacterium]|nr:carcinine hydrolase/isopenicillin-N N-acyltransferase family protein [Syntrophales bacterium]